MRVRDTLRLIRVQTLLAGALLPVLAALAAGAREPGLLGLLLAYGGLVHVVGMAHNQVLDARLDQAAGRTHNPLSSWSDEALRAARATTRVWLVNAWLAGFSLATFITFAHGLAYGVGVLLSSTIVIAAGARYNQRCHVNPGAAPLLLGAWALGLGLVGALAAGAQGASLEVGVLTAAALGALTGAQQLLGQAKDAATDPRTLARDPAFPGLVLIANLIAATVTLFVLGAAWNVPNTAPWAAFTLTPGDGVGPWSCSASRRCWGSRS